MKRSFAMLLCLMLVLCACSSKQPQQTTLSTTESTTAPTVMTTDAISTAPPVTFEAPLVALSMPVSTVKSVADDGVLLYTHTTQAFSLILPDPDAANMITNDFLNKTNAGSNAARLVHEAATTDYKGQTDWVPYVYSNLYAPVRLDQTVLSMYGTESFFDGSAGSATVNLSMTYDLLNGNLLEEISQILTPDYSADALCSLIYAQLEDLANEGILYADYQYTISDMFNTNTPVKNWYLSETGLCFYFMAYEIAPHSAGTVEAVIPYSSLSGLLLDRYFPEETVDMPGTPVVVQYSDSIAYTQLAELNLSEDGGTYALYADGALFDVTVSLQDQTDSNQTAVPVFAAASIGTGDVIMIRCSDLSELLISYRANGEYVQANLGDLFA